MPTPNRGYPEIPGAVTPDVPYRVNEALRDIDEDVQDLETALRGAIASAASRPGQPGEPLEYEDAVIAGLLAKSGTATAKQLARNYVGKADVSGAGFPAWSGIQRMYVAGSAPADGPRAGDLVLTVGGESLGPANMGGCTAWYDASTLTYTPGTQIWRMDDLSGHGRVLSATSDNAPVFQSTSGSWARARAVFSNASKNRWISYTKTNEVIAAAAGDYSVVVVASPAAKPSDGTVSMVFGGSGSNILFSAARNAWSAQCAGLTFYAPAGVMVPDDTARFFLYEYNHATKILTLTIDGTELIRSQITGAGTPGIVGGLTLGAQTANGSNPYWGSISEVAVFDRGLTAQEKTDLRTVARTRWAVA